MELDRPSHPVRFAPNDGRRNHQPQNLELLPKLLAGPNLTFGRFRLGFSFGGHGSGSAVVPAFLFSKLRHRAEERLQAFVL